jgi:putative transposase
MPRAPRIEFAGAIYHVMNRGNQFGLIYRSDDDRKMFVKTLGETCISSGWSLHSFVMMDNHYHLLIETHRPTLVKGMQYLNSTYTQRFNSAHKTRGHLFQGRYKALLVDPGDGGYFLTVSDYIHLNPVRVKGVRRVTNLKDLLSSQWSSVGWLSGQRKGRPQWLRWERVYGELGMTGWRSRDRREYREYLSRRLREVAEGMEFVEGIRRGWCLGSEGFVNQMKMKLEDMMERPRDAESWAGEALEEMEEDRAQEILLRGVKRLGYKEIKEVQGIDRYLLAKAVRAQTKVSVKGLAGHLGLASRGGLSHSVFLVGKRMEQDRRLRKRYEMLFI